MRTRLLLVCLILFLGFSVIEGRGDDKGQPPAQKPRTPEDAPAANRGVSKGMPASKVIEIVGQPRRIARQILFRSHVEQWSYEEPIDLRIELRGVRGQEAQVVSVHSLRSKKP